MHAENTAYTVPPPPLSLSLSLSLSFSLSLQALPLSCSTHVTVILGALKWIRLKVDHITDRYDTCNRNTCMYLHLHRVFP